MRLHVNTAQPKANTGKGGQNRKLPDVVLIHGTGSNGDMWQKQVEYLVDRGHRCIVPDLRGHGRTEEPGQRTDLEVHLEDITETLRLIDIAYPAVFVGHSLGAIISLTLAERQPDYFQRIFAAAVPGRVLKPMEHAFRWFLNGPYHSLRDSDFHARLPWRERTLLSTSHHTLEQIVDNFADLSLVDRPLNVSCPVHFAVGRFDPVAPYFYVKKLHESLPQSTLKVYEWSGHNFMDLKHKSFYSWLDQHLDSG